MDKQKLQPFLRKLPGVDQVLCCYTIKKQIELNGLDLVTFVVRSVIESSRKTILKNTCPVEAEEIVRMTEEAIALITQPLLKEVINATGIAIHTNLGRAPLGKKVLEDIAGIVTGYSNLEYDLNAMQRGRRGDHVVPLITYLTGAEDAIVVNNNAAGIMLALATFAKDKEVIVSRGELVEIGGSFRVPEILEASGAIMVEVGTTNKTHLADYEKAINNRTALLMKTHRSNFNIVGFTEEVSVSELAKLSQQQGIPLLYDIGSGLIRKPKGLPLESEPDVKSAINNGADLVAFSGDKLLGGPQAGILAGRKDYIAAMKSAPMMRALRVDKLTLAVLSSVVRSYFSDESLRRDIPLFAMLEQSEEQLKKKAETLLLTLQAHNVMARVVKSVGRCGGGTMPAVEISSYAIQLLSGKNQQKERSLFAENVFNKLHGRKRPIIAVLRQGDVLLDILTIPVDDFPYIAEEISQVLGGAP